MIGIICRTLPERPVRPPLVRGLVHAPGAVAMVLILLADQNGDILHVFYVFAVPAPLSVAPLRLVSAALRKRKIHSNLIPVLIGD